MVEKAVPLHRIAVLGGRGMLGTDLVARLTATGHEPLVSDLPTFDIRREDHLAAAVRAADAVVNCAAYTNVDRAESEPDLARAVNAEAVGRLGRIAAGEGKPVLHIGTDFVFDGALDRPYAETDRPHPISVYGATKLAGEEALQTSGCAWTIVRVQWTYGRAGQNFITKFLDRVRGGGELKMVADQTGAPTWTGNVAAALVELLDGRVTGLFHYAADGYATRYDVAALILRERGVDRALTACRTADFPAPARRPLNSRFDCRRIDGVLQRPRPAWQDALRRFLASTAPDA